MWRGTLEKNVGLLGRDIMSVGSGYWCPKEHSTITFRVKQSKMDWFLNYGDEDTTILTTRQTTLLHIPQDLHLQQHGPGPAALQSKTNPAEKLKPLLAAFAKSQQILQQSHLQHICVIIRVADICTKFNTANLQLSRCSHYVSGLQPSNLLLQFLKCKTDDEMWYKFHTVKIKLGAKLVYKCY